MFVSWSVNKLDCWCTTVLIILAATTQTDEQDEPAEKRLRLDPDSEAAQELVAQDGAQDVQVQEVQIAQDFTNEIPESGEQVVSSEG